MNKKIFLLILIPLLLVIGAYLFIHFKLQSSVDKKSKHSSLKPSADTTSLKQNSLLDLRPLFIKKLQQVVTKSSNGLYDLSVADMNVDVLASTVSLQNVTLLPNEETLASLIKNAQAPNDVFKISFKSFVIEGINLDDALTNKTMDYKLIKLVNPVITIHHIQRKIGHQWYGSHKKCRGGNVYLFPL